MAEGSVTFLLAKLSEILEKEGKLVTGVRKEAQYIKDELEFMKAFLRVADMEENDDEQLTALVKMVKDVTYDMEDALDYYKQQLSHDHGRGPLDKASHFVADLRARRKISRQMQDIKSRVINISETHRRYLIKNNIVGEGSSSGRATRLARSGDVLLREETNPVGIESPKRELISLLVGGQPEREVVSVVGAGGLGKSTLAKKVYRDTYVKQQFKFRAWITVSQSFKTEDLLRDIIQQLHRELRKPDPEGLDIMDNDKLRMEICKLLGRSKYLVVLDDVWHFHAWDALEHALPTNSSGSRILLTTQNAQVASAACMEFPNKVYTLRPLSPEDSLLLFCNKIFKENFCPPHLENVAKKILLRCEGLPLAIVAISGVLLTKDKSRVDEWDLVYRSLEARLEDNDQLRSMKRILSLSYNDLPDNLKSCLLYFSVFPKGYPIEHMRLVRLWIAEGFVKEREGMTLEEVAEDYLNELVKRNLVQVVEATSDGRIKRCRIQDLLHDIMILKSRREGFVAIANGHSRSWPERVRRLSVHDASSSIQQTQASNPLRSLLTFWRADLVSESHKFKLAPCRLKLLNVLDLGGAPLKKFPEEVVGLVLLKYLSLRNTKVELIPSTIGKLLNLETLDLKHARVTELPIQILKLEKLRHLLVYRYDFEYDDPVGTKYGFKAPDGIGSLQFLQKLCFLEANDGSNLMKELGRLSQLRRLGIVNLRKEDGKALCLSIEKLINLRALSITSVHPSEIIDLEHLSAPPIFLQRLYLTGSLERLPNWISSLDSLVKLVLKGSRLSEDPLPSLQQLPNLVHLEFVEVYDGETLFFQAMGFKRLKFLGLNKLHRLRTITVERGAMPCLENFIVQSCKSLLGLPTGIEHLSELKVFELFDVPVDFVKRLLPAGEGEDNEKSNTSNSKRCSKPGTSFAQAFDQLLADHMPVRIFCSIVLVAVLIFFLHLVDCLMRIQRHFALAASQSSTVLLSRMEDYPLLCLSLYLLFLLYESYTNNFFTKSCISWCRRRVPLFKKKVQNAPEIYCTCLIDGDRDDYSVEFCSKGTYYARPNNPNRRPEYSWKP